MAAKKTTRSRSRKPKHLDALKIPYEEYVVLNGGESCGICGSKAATRRLHRDHDHRTGQPRGLLCFRCNRNLPTYATADWLRAAVAYLER